MEERPQFKIAVGALIAVFPEARQDVETNIEEMLQNKQTPEQAVDNAAKAINESIDKYNKENK
jgi:sn-glycerol 3-phosphate transport system substrate-binding protein